LNSKLAPWSLNDVAKRNSIETITNAHPGDAVLFGELGAVAAQLCDDLEKDFVGKRFEFMDIEEFRLIRNHKEKARIYWTEMLFRVFWAAALNLMRHKQWQSACVREATDPSNLLGFAAALRGMLESAQDAWYSLSPVVSSLAEHQIMIELAINGQVQKFVIAHELEDLLIHFIYGRKLDKKTKGTPPPSHVALEPKDYRNAIGLPDDERERFKALYDYLCGICHPTAYSLIHLWQQEPDGIIQITSGNDLKHIALLCNEYKSTLSLALSLSVTHSALCLKALNWFSLSETKCPAIDRWRFDDVPAWRKANAKLLNQLSRVASRTS
jgi:hypothetical protein